MDAAGGWFAERDNRGCTTAKHQVPPKPDLRVDNNVSVQGGAFIRYILYVIYYISIYIYIYIGYIWGRQATCGQRVSLGRASRESDGKKAEDEGSGRQVRLLDPMSRSQRGGRRRRRRKRKRLGDGRPDGDLVEGREVFGSWPVSVTQPQQGLAGQRR